MDRREFLKSAATATAAIPFGAFISRVEARGAGRQAAQAAYGPLTAVADETTGLPLLMLPAGFRYLSLGWTADVMSSGPRTPGAHDGMAAFRAGGRHLGLSGNASELARNGQQDGGERHGHLAVLVRNHEQGRGTPFSSAAYDVAAAGGTTTLVFDSQHGEVIESGGSISGTIRNCAGGPTPWNSWMTCEETNDFTTVPHGEFGVP